MRVAVHDASVCVLVRCVGLSANRTRARMCGSVDATTYVWRDGNQPIYHIRLKLSTILVYIGQHKDGSIVSSPCLRRLKAVHAFRNSLDESSERQHIAMALHQQRQAKCRQVRAASMAKQRQRQEEKQQRQNQQSQNSNRDTQMAENIREFYRTPTMLVEDEPPFFQEEPEEEVDRKQYPEEKEYGYEQEHEREDAWRAISTEEPSSTSYDVNSFAEDPDSHGTSAPQGGGDVFTSKRLDKFNPNAPLWMPPESDRRTPTLPWTSSLDADTLMEAKAASSSSAAAVAGGHRKSTKKTPAPPPPMIRGRSPSDSDTSLT
ncbi:hypothetical protein ACTXT7_002230 [Hymenolepis weldensis]